MRITAIFLIIALLIQGGTQAFARILDKNEVWSGFKTLKEDVIVPSGCTLTISSGTHVLTNGNKIISYGKVDIHGTKEEQVKFLPLIQLGTSESEIEVLKVKPYDIDTKTLREEFEKFKIQYTILWSLLFASIFITLEEAR